MDPATTLTRRGVTDRAWIIRKYEADGLHDAAMMFHPTGNARVKSADPHLCEVDEDATHGGGGIGCRRYSTIKSPDGAENTHLGFSMAIVAAMAVGVAGTSREMDVPPGFVSFLRHARP
jgi:hypothetical protein